MILTGVRSFFCAAHRGKDGVLHGHTWQVICWWDDEPDAVMKQKELDHYLKVFDHSLLSDGIAWAEYLAKTILVGMDCVKVEVKRPIEGLYATVSRDGFHG